MHDEKLSSRGSLAALSRSRLTLRRGLTVGMGVALLASFAPPPIPAFHQVSLPKAQAANLPIQSVQLNECWFDGQRHERNFGSVDYGPVQIILETLPNPPAGFGPRPKQITGFVMPGLTVGNRQETPQPSAGFHTGGEDDVDPGHVFALHLGGPDDARNIVPMWAKWQRLEAWRKMEQDLDKKAREVADASRPPEGGPPKKTLFYNIAIVYRDTGDITPTLTAWAFPKEFYVSACVTDIGNTSDCDEWYLRNQKFEGEPPH